MRLIQLREVDKPKAKEEILQYLKDRKRAETFDIAHVRISKESISRCLATAPSTAHPLL